MERERCRWIPWYTIITVLVFHQVKVVTLENARSLFEENTLEHYEPLNRQRRRWPLVWGWDTSYWSTSYFLSGVQITITLIPSLVTSSNWFQCLNFLRLRPYEFVTLIPSLDTLSNWFQCLNFHCLRLKTEVSGNINVLQCIVK